MYPILEKRRLAEGIWLMKVLAPRVARSAQPGQFVIVRSRRTRRAHSAHDLRFRRCGGQRDHRHAGHRRLDAQNLRTRTRAMPSPTSQVRWATLRNSSKCPSKSCANAATSSWRAAWAQPRSIRRSNGSGNTASKADVIIGAKTRDMLIYTDAMRAVAEHLYIATDDGSEGFKGLVTALIGELDRKRGQTLRRMRGHRPDDYDEVRGPHHEEVRAENHRVAQCADGRRHGHVRRLPRDGRRPDALHVRRRPGVRRPRGRFRRGDAPAGHVPHPGAARRGDRGRARGRTRM